MFRSWSNAPGQHDRLLGRRAERVTVRVPDLSIWVHWAHRLVGGAEATVGGDGPAAW